MTPADFCALHVPALERDEVRQNLILGILAWMVAGDRGTILTWTLGPPGHCAIKAQGRPIVLGDLSEAECRALAEMTMEVDYPGVTGVGSTAAWFADRARELGIAFLDPIPQRIHSLTGPPTYPGAPGYARPATAGDAILLAVPCVRIH